MSNAYRKRTCKAAAGLLLAGCLAAAPAFSQEIIKWVDEDGVTHFGHAATAARRAMQEHMRDEVDELQATLPAEASSPEHAVPAAAAGALGTVDPGRLSASNETEGT